MAITLPEHEHACVEKLRQARAVLQPRQFIPRPTRVVSLSLHRGVPCCIWAVPVYLGALLLVLAAASLERELIRTKIWWA